MQINLTTPQKWGLVKDGQITRIDAKPHLAEPQAYGWLPITDVKPDTEDFQKAIRNDQAEWTITDTSIIVTYTVRDWIEDEYAVWRSTLENGPVQFRRALRFYDLKDQIDQYVATLSEAEQEDWAAATSIKRTDPLVVTAMSMLGFTDEQADQVFIKGLELA